MRIFSKDSHINFMSKRNIALVFSSVLIIASLVSLGVKGLNFGIDFTGGTLVEVAYAEPVELAGVRKTLVDAGFKEATAQHFGTPRDVLVRVAPREGVAQDTISDQVLEALKTGDSTVELRRREFVGPQVGEELTEQGGLALLYAMIGILFYVWMRFEYRFSIGSVIALAHDVIIALGAFAFWQLEFNLPVLAALLAIIGYSLNDTIVVFDRIRENFRKMRKGSPIDVMNVSINQTLSRTLVTSLTTLLVLLALLILGGEVIFGFAMALIIGVVIGTYSSIYVASTSALYLGVNRADLMPVDKEKQVDDRP